VDTALYAYSKDTSVAWNSTICDSHGSAYEPTFRLPHPPCDSASVRDQPEQVQHVVAAITPVLHLLELLLWGNTKPHLEEHTAGDNNR